MRIAELLQRDSSSGCDNLDSNFSGIDQTGLIEPDCKDWEGGFSCFTKSLLKKINWMFNRIIGALSSIDERLIVVERWQDETVFLIDLEFDEDTRTVTEVYSDGSTIVNDLASYDTDTDQVVSVTFDSQTGIQTLTNEDGSTVVSQMPTLSSANAPVFSQSLDFARNPRLAPLVLTAGIDGDQQITHNALSQGFSTPSFPSVSPSQMVLIQANWMGLLQGSTNGVDLSVSLQQYDSVFDEWRDVAKLTRHYDANGPDGTNQEVHYTLPPVNAVLEDATRFRFVGLSENYTTGSNGLFFARARVTFSVVG